MSQAALRQIAPGIWTIESFFRSFGCKGSLRMTIVETRGGLILYSPVRLTADSVQAIEAIDDVTTIIAPNLYHHMFLRDCAAKFPNARLCVPKNLETKIGAVVNADIIDEGTVFGSPEDVEQFTFFGHGIRETMLYHVPSKSLITADLLYNYTPDQFFAEKLWFRLIGCYGRPDVAFYHRFSIKDLASVSTLIRWVEAREVQRVVMCHGQIVVGENAGNVFAAAWKRLAKLG